MSISRSAVRLLGTTDCLARPCHALKEGNPVMNTAITLQVPKPRAEP